MMSDFDRLVQHYRQAELRDEAAQERLIQAVLQAQRRTSRFAGLMSLVGGLFMRIGESLQRPYEHVLRSQAALNLNHEPQALTASRSSSTPPC